MSPTTFSVGSPFGRRPSGGFPERLERSFAHHLAEGTWPVAGARDLQVSLHSTSAAPAIARRWAHGFLDERVLTRELDDVLLMLTELVTNAVRHATTCAGGFVDLHLAVAPQRVRVEVRDVGRGFALPTPKADPLSAGGYGLLIVDRASSRWGMSDELPHCVWFEVDREAQPA